MVSAQWCLNPSPQRQSSVYPSAQRQTWASPLWGSHSASFFPSSFMVAVTVSPRMTLVIYKFKLLTEVVTTNTYPFSSSVWLGGAMGLVNLTPDVVVEAVWVAASIRLASCPIGQSSIWSLVEGTVVYLLSGRDPNDEEVVDHVSWAPAESESVLPMSVGVGWGHWLIVPR